MNKKRVLSLVLSLLMLMLLVCPVGALADDDVICEESLDVEESTIEDVVEESLDGEASNENVIEEEILGDDVSASEQEEYVTAEASLTVTGPEDYVGNVGDTAEFTVKASGGTGSYTYQWQVNNKGTWKDSTLEGYDTKTLKVVIQSNRIGNKYRCIVTSGTQEVTSNEATLMKTSATKLTVSGPEDYVGNVGDIAKFTVKASGGTGSYVYRWQVNSKGTWKDTTMEGNTTPTLSVEFLSNRNGYKYRCIVTSGTQEVTSSEATLKKVADITIDGVVYAKLTSTTCYVKAYQGDATSLTIPERVSEMTVVEIGEEAFMGNTALVSIDLPDTVTVIRARAFKNCTNLSSMS